jgi:polyhydroxyalkanoate synthesis regulator phasin
MVLDGLRSYVQLASGLTDVTRERARAAARALVAQGEVGVGAVLPDTVRVQVSSLTDDLIAASRANRTLLINLLRVEIDRSVGRLGLVSSAELDSATRRAARLEARVADLELQLRQARSGTAKKASRKTAAAKTAAAKKSTAKQAAAKQAAAKKIANKSAAESTVPTSSAPTSSAPTSSAPTSSAPTNTAPTSSPPPAAGPTDASSTPTASSGTTTDEQTT